MNKVVSIILFFFVSGYLYCQTKEEFLLKIQENIHSYSKLKPILNEFKNDNNKWVQPKVFLGAKAFYHSFRLKDSASIYGWLHSFPVRVIYLDDKVLYLSIVRTEVMDGKKIVSDTIYRYVDSLYSAKFLTQFNTENGTIFTWRDLFEDNINYFIIEPGIGFWKENEPKTIWEEIYVPMLKRKDHAAIQKECKSFNPVRRAYGAFALYNLQKAGKKLSPAEVVMLNNITTSKTPIDFSQGCDNYSDKPTDEVLRISIADYFRKK